MGEEKHYSLTAPKLWFMTPFANHIWCLDHLDGLTHLSCISRLTKMSKMTNTFCVPLMEPTQSTLEVRSQRDCGAQTFELHQGNLDLPCSTI